MLRKSLLPVLSLLFISVIVTAQDARTIIANSMRAMGSENLNSVTYFGSGANFNLGQNPNANQPWPRRSVQYRWLLHCRVA